jgi:predicted GIY-YIG superfamily endonuclease
MPTYKFPNVTMYLIHIEPRYRHAGHYLGITRDDRPVEERFAEHLAGQGARLTRVAIRAGCELILDRIWEDMPAGRETAMKAHSLTRYCLTCRARRKRGIAIHVVNGSASPVLSNAVAEF